MDDKTENKSLFPFPACHTEVVNSNAGEQENFFAVCCFVCFDCCCGCDVDVANIFSFFDQRAPSYEYALCIPSPTKFFELNALKAGEREKRCVENCPNYFIRLL